MVWTPYELWADGKTSHCGIDVFDLLKEQGVWKIANAMWTVEPDACHRLRPQGSVAHTARAPGRVRPAGPFPPAYRAEPRYTALGNRGNTVSKPQDLVQGTLDLLLLKIIALQPMNGHAISLRLKQVSGDVLQVSDGSLYPALHKLEQAGWITATWQTTDNNRRAKFYALSRPGRRHLDKEAENWARLSAAITHVVALDRA